MVKRILIVDDEPEWCGTFYDIVKSMDYDVDAIEKFGDAQRSLANNRYDLAIIDIRLDSDPAYTSFQKLCFFLQQRHPAVPILATSAHEITPDFMFSLHEEHGVSGFVYKPKLRLPNVKKQIIEIIHRNETIPILFLAANPRDEQLLNQTSEIDAIKKALDTAPYGDRFELIKRWQTRISDIQTHLLRHPSAIVHISGHGSSTNELVFENEDGYAQSVPVRALSDLFGLLQDKVKCVVLNACYSEAQARAISSHIDCVIGTSSIISDDAAIKFAEGFYRGLAHGYSVESSFKLGCIQIDLNALGEDERPILLTHFKDPGQITFVAPK